MATDMQRLIVSLEAKTVAFEKAMNRALGVANQRSRQIESRFAKMNASIGRRMAMVGRGWVAGIAAGIGARELKQLSDSATRIDNALKVAGLSGAELEKVYGKLRDSAVKNAAPIESLVELYSRASLVQKELGVTSDELVGFSNNVALALRVSGKTAQESSGALLQLSQALGSGAVRAEEFNSIQEGAPTILQAVAAGLKEAEGSVAKLRSMVIEGEVSSEAFFRAFEAGAPILQDRVAGSTYTVEQAMGNLRTALIDVAREFNQSTGASERFASGINTAAQAISDFDVSGFIGKISEAKGALEGFLADLGNAQVFKDLNIALGITDADGNMLNLDASEAQAEAESLERDVKRLQAMIANNTELGFDNTEALAQLDQVLGKLAQVRAAIANMPTHQEIEPITGRDLTGKPYQVGTPGDPNALAGRPVNLPAKVKPVSVTDFTPPAKRGGGGGGGGGGRKGRGGGGSGGNDYDREIEQIIERTEALRAETAALATVNPLIDDYDYTLTKATATHELLTAAQKAGIAVTPELKASIEALAGGYASATAEANKLAEAQDNARQTADDFKQLGKDVLGGFIKDLQAGKSATEALANALDKVADKLLDMALDSLFDGGGLGGILSLFGFAKGGVAANGRPQPLKKFARGGVSRSAAIFGEAGPEAAVPLPDGRSIPVTLSAPRIPGGKGGSETIHIRLQDDSGRMADIADKRIQTNAGTIVRVAVDQSTKAVKANMPGYIANAQMRNL